MSGRVLLIYTAKETFGSLLLGGGLDPGDAVVAVSLVGNDVVLRRGQETAGERRRRESDGERGTDDLVGEVLGALAALEVVGVEVLAKSVDASTGDGLRANGAGAGGVSLDDAGLENAWREG